MQQGWGSREAAPQGVLGVKPAQLLCAMDLHQSESRGAAFLPPRPTEGNVVTSPESFLAAEILLRAVWLQPLDPASPIPFLSSTVQPHSPEEFCFPGHDALLSSVWCCPSCAYCSLCMKDTCVLAQSPRYGLSGSMEMLPRRHLPCIRGRRCPGAPAYQRNGPIITLPLPLQLSVPSLGDQPL